MAENERGGAALASTMDLCIASRTLIERSHALVKSSDILMQSSRNAIASSKLLLTANSNISYV
jgi:hypothetical protein